jgi:HlyD family secretion protein
MSNTQIRRRASSIRAVLVFAAIAPLVAAGCGKKEEAPAVEVEVQAANVEKISLSEHIVASAILAPLAQAAIAPKVSAPVKTFYVQRGAKVQEGQLLARLENQDLAAAAEDNQGSYHAAEATYQSTTLAEVPEQFQKAELDVAQAKANLDLNQQIVSNRTQLFAEGAVPGRDLDTARAALVQAQATYDSAMKHLDGMKQVSREAALKGAQGQLESAKAKYMGAAAQLSYTEIRSPIRGVVTDRPLFAGETVPAGAPLITVMDLSALIAKVHIAQAQAPIVKVGDKAAVAIDGAPDPVEGKVVLASPALDPGSTTVEIWVRVENLHGRLRPGTTVHVSLEAETVRNALAVPKEAIVSTKGGSDAVMVIGADGIVHQKVVQTGIEDGGKVQITQGVSEGQRVVTQGAYALDDGTKVKIGKREDKEDDKAAGNAGGGE